MSDSIFQFEVTDIDGKRVSLQNFRGKVLLIVNVASKCGFTPQYEGLEALRRQLGPRGFEVLGFPCNQFGSQEPGDAEEIKNFCRTSYSVTFPLFAKIEVNGDKTDPLFVFLKHASRGILGTEAIKWNFTKFLVSRDGNEIIRYAPTSTPQSIIPDIDRLLGPDTANAGGATLTFS